MKQKVTGVTKLLKAHVKNRSFLLVTVNMHKRNILLVTKLALGRIWNTLFTSLLNYTALSLCFFNCHKLKLSINKVLYLHKQPLVVTLQKKLFYRALFFNKTAALHLYKNRVPLQIFLQLFDHCCKLLVFYGVILSGTLVFFRGDLIVSRH